MKLFKRRSREILEANSKAKSIKEKIKTLGRLHKQNDADMKSSIGALAKLFAFRKGIIPHRNPKDKRRR